MPFFIFPNHQNALLDPLLVGTTANQSIHSLTRSDVFGGPLQWFLDAMQTLPVYRIRDGYSQLKNNDEVFERCYEILGQKKHMMMFSEGRHHEEHYLLPFLKEVHAWLWKPSFASPSMRFISSPWD